MNQLRCGAVLLTLGRVFCLQASCARHCFTFITAAAAAASGSHTYETLAQWPEIWEPAVPSLSSYSYEREDWINNSRLRSLPSHTYTHWWCAVKMFHARIFSLCGFDATISHSLCPLSGFWLSTTWESKNWLALSHCMSHILFTGLLIDSYVLFSYTFHFNSVNFSFKFSLAINSRHG